MTFRARVQNCASISAYESRLTRVCISVSLYDVLSFSDMLHQDPTPCKAGGNLKFSGSPWMNEACKGAVKWVRVG